LRFVPPTRGQVADLLARLREAHLTARVRTHRTSGLVESLHVRGAVVNWIDGTAWCPCGQK
jgi:hypothetical protein